MPEDEKDILGISDKRERSSTLFAKKSTEGDTTSLDDFEVRSIIGQGTFGKVYLVEHTKTCTFYAMKSIRKDVVIDHEQLENLRLEKHILLCVDHPFLIRMEYVFQKTYRIYFLMEFVKGGELYKHLSDVRRFSEERAKFYSVQIVLALGYLHESKVVYRDLKPENILLSQDGYIRLADFGLAKMLGEEIANSFCGTPEYLSPEMILGTGHDHTLDWWTLGILLYEMVVGIPPFYHPNKHKMYYMIQKAGLKWPQADRHGFEISAEA